MTLTPQVLSYVLSCDEHGHYRHGSLQSNYALYAILMYTHLYAHAALLQTLASSPQLSCSQSGRDVWNHYLRIGLVVWHWVSVSEALMKHPRGELAQQGCC